MSSVFFERERYFAAPPYDSLADAREGIGGYFGFFNDRRPHSSLGGQTPAAFYDSALRLVA